MFGLTTQGNLTSHCCFLISIVGWQSFPPCKAAAYELGEEFDEDLYGDGANKTFDDVGSHMLRNAKADVFLFYSQTFSENEVAIASVDKIIDQYFEGGGWAQCFDNIYAVEANIPADLDNYIPPMQEYLYNWVSSALDLVLPVCLGGLKCMSQ